MLSCREVTELVTDYTEGRMSFRQRMSFRVHLAMCSFCRRYVSQMTAVAGAAAHAETPAPPADVVDPLVRAFAARAPGVDDDKR